MKKQIIEVIQKLCEQTEDLTNNKPKMSLAMEHVFLMHVREAVNHLRLIEDIIIHTK